ncbi:MAG: molybdenum cofactor biosynthesis protein MoaE [Candidatus Bathyarchaeota archaeon]|jgi:molybdopterin synthase catalytic subunit
MSVKAGVHEKGTISISSLLESTRKKPGFHKVGAIATFIGVVRGETKEGQTVKGLELEAYKEKADELLENICKELQNKEGIVDVQIHHMIGEFCVGEELVYVLVAGSHRKHVFPVLEEAVDRYKREAPIFKKETVTNKKGIVKSYWVSEGKTE